jgi:hypothetical protein
MSRAAIRLLVAALALAVVAAGCAPTPDMRPTASPGTSPSSATMAPTATTATTATIATSPPGVTGGPSTSRPSATVAPSASDRTLAAPSDPNVVPGASVNDACASVGISPHVAGQLVGDPDDPAWPVWVESLTGRQMFVLWPAGFRVRFGLRLQLIDETGQVVSTGSVELDQVGVGESQGTRADPYRARGILFGRCYVLRPSP